MHRLTETVRQEHDFTMNMHHDTASFEDPLNDDEELFDSWSPGYPEAPHHLPSETSPPTDDLTRTLRGRNMSGLFEALATRTPGAQDLDHHLGELSEISGFIAAAIVDTESGVALTRRSVDGDFDVDVAAAVNADVVRAKGAVMAALGFGNDDIDDILITLDTQYHLIRPSRNDRDVFIYLSLDRRRANLALARHFLAEVEAKIRA
jgi:predicted regulator of Ras-like GTPase activity (Roadblock/LC7/MglB family)